LEQKETKRERESEKSSPRCAIFPWSGTASPDQKPNRREQRKQRSLFRLSVISVCSCKPFRPCHACHPWSWFHWDWLLNRPKDVQTPGAGSPLPAGRRAGSDALCFLARHF
jgi:hypothetical protein